MEEQRYKNITSKYTKSPNIFKNCILAFLMGALMGVLGNLEFDLIVRYSSLDKTLAMSMVSVTFILISAILTGIGQYKKLGQIFGAGLFIPITGFSNSMVSEAMEFRFEGPVYGVGSRVFSLAGSVITYGVGASFIYGVIYYILTLFGVRM